MLGKMGSTSRKMLTQKQAEKVEEGSKSSRTQKARPVYSDSDDDSLEDDSLEEDEEAEDYIFKVMALVNLLRGHLRKKKQ